MTSMRIFLSIQEQFFTISTRDITYVFIQEGYPMINKYSKGVFHRKGRDLLPKAYCFDDLGVESNIKYYGNNTNVMAEILLIRYEMFIHSNMVTHAITNLSASEIESYYGNRVRSRLREMLNILAFSNDSNDKNDKRK